MSKDNGLNFYHSKLISLQGKHWSLFDLNYEDDSSNDFEEEVKNDISSVSCMSGSTNGLIINPKYNNDTMKLKREDMCLFGRCPANDQFYLVVCEYCGQVIKPQALARHIESRHKLIPNHNHKEESNSINSLDNSINYLSQGLKIAESNNLHNHSLSNCNKNFRVTSQFYNSNNKSLDQANVKKSSHRGKLLPCKDREYDPDKHCGVKTLEMEKPCTRSLTCKTHSLTMRRAVQDRSKNFDELLSEHRAAKEAALKNNRFEVQKNTEKEQHSQQSNQQNHHHHHHYHHHHHHYHHHHHHPSQLQQQVKSKNQELKRQLLNSEKEVKFGTKINNQLAESKESERQSAKMSMMINNNNWKESSIEEIKPEMNNHVSSPESYSVISYEGSLYLPNHPKPLALCTFNARQLSLSSFDCDFDENRYDLSSRLFNRKRDLTYYALNLFKDKLKKRIKIKT